MSERRQSVSAAEEPPAAPTLPSPVSVAAPARRARGASPHAHKFLAATAMLIGFAIGALAIAALLLSTGSRPTAGPRWSAWAPSDSGLAGEREIAAAVSPFYRAAPATQLVVVTVNNVSSATSGAASSGTQIALHDPTTGALAALGGTTAMYNLCGLGPNCAISTGTPTAARMLLLRREVLELALYTFKYINGIDNVVAILPPAHATTTPSLTPAPPASTRKASLATAPVELAILLQRQALGPYLSVPLRATLPDDLPPTAAEMPYAREAELVSVLTGQTLFEQRLVQAQDGSRVLVLTPVPPQ